MDEDRAPISDLLRNIADHGAEVVHIRNVVVLDWYVAEPNTPRSEFCRLDLQAVALNLLW